MTSMYVEVESRLIARLAQHLHVEPPSLDLSRSFTHHGGHSLSAVALSHSCKEMGIAVTVRDILKAPSMLVLIKEAASRIANVNGLQLNGIFEQNCRDSSLVPDKVEIALSNKQYPATEMQMSLIRGTYENPKWNIIYHRQNCKATDLAMLRNAWETVITREEMFYSDFNLRNGSGFWIRKCRPFSWTEVSVKHQHELEAEVLQPPGFTGIGYAFKAIIATALGSNSRNSCLVFQVHHALIDGYSMEQLLAKVTQVVLGLTPAPSPSMLDFLAQRHAYVEGHQHNAVRFWNGQRDILSRAVGELGLPPQQTATETELSTEATFLSDSYTFDLGPSRDTIASFVQEHNITEAALYHGAWGLVMSLLADSDCIVFGVAMSGRTIPIAHALDVIGNLATTVPLTIDIQQDMTTIEYLRYILLRTAELASFEWALPDGCYDRRFSSMVSLQFEQSLPGSQYHDTAAGWSSRMNTEIPISITIESRGTVNIQYSRTRYSDAMVRHAGIVFQRMITSLLRPTHSVAMCLLSAVSLEEQSSLRKIGNCHSALSTKASVQDSLVSLFRLTAAQFPEAIAAQCAGQSMTYRELDLDSDRLCLELSQWIRTGDVVCVHADQSLSWLKAIYGVLKSGATYCPMNPKLSVTLQASNFLSSGAKVYVVPSIEQNGCIPAGCPYHLAVDEILSKEPSEQPSARAQADPISPNTGAYLCFTSGSTGTPKGVLCTHQGLVAFQRDLEVRLFARPGWKIAQTMSVSFDGSIHEVFSALSYGATLILPNECDPFAHLADVDAAIFTPSVAKVLQPTDYPNLQTVYLVGEQVSREVCNRWASEKRLYNMYGPTEATCGATIKCLRAGDKITIGSPNCSTRVYILDRHRRLTVPGWIGQVCLAGVQVSMGYVDHPEATREKFFPDPICDGLRESTYCTGDLGYWTGSGEIVLLGRTDRQIKLRGFRIDLDDLEAQISYLPEVSAAAVISKDDHLLAMVRPNIVSIPKLQAAMAANLPTHAIPRFVTAVSEFPLTKAGKLDYAKIRDSELWASGALYASMNDVELKVAKVWQDILGLKDLSKLGPDAQFSFLGGHSLHQLRLASGLSHAFSRHVPLSLVIQSQKLCDQARLITGLDNHDSDEKESISITDNSADQPESLSSIEVWWIERYSQAACSSSFNVSFACDLPSDIDRARLAQSWNTTLARHCILSSRYIPAPDSKGFVRSWHSVRPKAQQVDDKDLDIAAELNRPFDVKRDYLIRVHISPTRMLVVVSHIVCDLTTMRLILEDVASLYNGKTLLGPSLTYPGSRLAGVALPPTTNNESFWIKYLKGTPESSNIARITPHGYHQRHTGTSITIKLPSATVNAVKTYVESYGVTKHQLAVAAVALALRDSEPSIDITIGSPYFNRRNEADLRTVGLYLEPIPIRVRFGDEMSPEASSHAYVQAVQSASQEAIMHAISWDRLQCIWKTSVVSTPDQETTIFDVMVTFHDEAAELTIPIVGTEPLYTWTEGAKFPLMCEFMAVKNGSVVMRLEYDDSVLSKNDIFSIGNKIATSLFMLATSCSLEHVRKALAWENGSVSVTVVTDESRELFLRRVSEL